MNVVCLMPTYGRPPHLIENALKCFLDQTYDKKFLLIYDDFGSMTPEKHDEWQVITSKERSPSLPSKYMFMIDFLDTVKQPWDAFCVWDDDDVYLPEHISLSVKAMQESPWSKPSWIKSTYTQEDGGTIPLEGSSRFHGSIALTKDFFWETGGWPITNRMEFDQEFIKQLFLHSSPGDYIEFGEAQYVFRWSDTGTAHCSADNGNQDWYADYKPGYAFAIPNLVPTYDRSTELILEKELLL